MNAPSVTLADPLLTVPTVATMIGVHDGTIRTWIKRGDLAAVKISRRCVRIRTQELERFLLARTRSAQ